MKRNFMMFLDQWLNSSSRKPLIIRGARQVGKTWLVRDLAKRMDLQLIELNFEKKPQLASLFKENEPRIILENMELALGIVVDPKKTLLFLDEIQAAPQLIAKLRWFAEDLPELAVIAAGSLLEFALENHTFSMPVGRISLGYLEPLSFQEFLLAKGESQLAGYLRKYQISSQIPLAIHEKLLSIFKEYFFVGGMPAAVNTWVETRSLIALQQVQQELLTTYRDDFARYRGRLSIELLEEAMTAIPQQLGEKITYSKINPVVQSSAVKQALELLCKARVAHVVEGCGANGVPLAGDKNHKYKKMIFLDVGLSIGALGLRLSELTSIEGITLVNRGGIAEQVVGQLLRTVELAFMEPALYYWHREDKGGSAEVDYLLQHGSQVIPVEVKAGATGSLKSLHLLMGMKKLKRAVRINSDYPSAVEVNLKTTQGETVSYHLLSLPFYLVEEIHRLIDQLP